MPASSAVPRLYPRIRQVVAALIALAKEVDTLRADFEAHAADTSLHIGGPGGGPGGPGGPP